MMRKIRSCEGPKDKGSTNLFCFIGLVKATVLRFFFPFGIYSKVFKYGEVLSKASLAPGSLNSLAVARDISFLSF